MEKFNLCYYWLRLKNSWVKIARTMGRTENWVKNNWKKLLKKEGISTNASPKELNQRISKLMESLKATGQVAEPSAPLDSPFDASYADVPEELELSEVSRSVVSDADYGMKGEEEEVEEEVAGSSPKSEAMTRRAERQLMKVALQDTNYGSGGCSKDEEKQRESEKEGTGGQSMDMEGVRVSAESEEFDFAANTAEKPGSGEDVDMDAQDVGKYMMRSQRGASPFPNNKRPII